MISVLRGESLDSRPAMPRVEEDCGRLSLAGAKRRRSLALSLVARRVHVWLNARAVRPRPDPPRGGTGGGECSRMHPGSVDGRRASCCGSSLAGVGCRARRGRGRLPAGAAVDHVLLTGVRVISPAEAKRPLAGATDTEALGDRVQRVVVLAVPIVRVALRRTRFTRLPWRSSRRAPPRPASPCAPGCESYRCLPRSLPIGWKRRRARRPTRSSSRSSRWICTCRRSERLIWRTTSCAWSGSRASGCSRAARSGRDFPARGQGAGRGREARRIGTGETLGSAAR